MSLFMILIYIIQHLMTINFQGVFELSIRFSYTYNIDAMEGLHQKGEI